MREVLAISPMQPSANGRAATRQVNGGRWLPFDESEPAAGVVTCSDFSGSAPPVEFAFQTGHRVSARRMHAPSSAKQTARGSRCGAS